MLNIKERLTGGRAYRVLVVDTEKYIGDMIKMSAVTTYDNIRVSSADSITEALHLIDHTDFDALIVNCHDLGDPYIEFVRKVKSIKNILPTISIVNNAEASGETRLSLIQAGTTFLMEKPFTLSEIMAVLNNLVELNEVYRGLEHSENIIKALTRAIEARDSYTIGHAEAVADLAVQMFDHMGLRGEQREDLYIGCLLHDIGKIGIPDNILNKPGKLTDEEYNLIKAHPEVGFTICKDLHKIKPSLQVILQHHERLDGSGYPHNTKGGDINILAQISSVADVYHSLTSNRSYRKAMDRESALSIIDEEVDEGKLNLFFVQSLKCILTETGCSDE